MDLDKSIIITDESGEEHEYEIVLTFDDDEKGISYVLVTDPTDDEGNVYPFTYDEDGNLDLVTDEAGINMCSEVLGAFIDEEGEEDE